MEKIKDHLQKRRDSLEHLSLHGHDVDKLFMFEGELQQFVSMKRVGNAISEHTWWKDSEISSASGPSATGGMCSIC